MVVLEDIDRMHSEYFLLHRFLKLHKAKVAELAPDVVQKDASNRRIILDNGCTIRFVDFEYAINTSFHHLSANCVFVIDYQNLTEEEMWKVVGKTFDTPKNYSPDVMLFFRMFTDRRGNLDEVVSRWVQNNAQRNN